MQFARARNPARIDICGHFSNILIGAFLLGNHTDGIFVFDKVSFSIQNLGDLRLQK